MEQDPDERRKKQEYLKKEILDMNYDKEEFAEFMMAHKPDGLNVENWGHTELIMAVDDFTRNHKPVEIGDEGNYDQPEPLQEEYHQDNEYMDPPEIYEDRKIEPEPFNQNEDNKAMISQESTIEEVTPDRTSERIEALKKMQEEEREKVRNKEVEESKKMEKKKKKTEKDSKKKEKKAKKVFRF